MFGVFGEPDKALFVDVLPTLTTIQNKENIKPTAHVKATGYRYALLNYETILTVQLFLCIFEETAPLSKYLQTIVVKTEEKLKKSMARDFESVKTAANTFVHWANEKLQELVDGGGYFATEEAKQKEKNARRVGGG